MSSEFYSAWRVLGWQLYFAWLQFASEMIELGRYYVFEEVPRQA